MKCKAIVLLLLCSYCVATNAQETKDTTKHQKQRYYGYVYLNYSTGNLTQTYDPSIGSLAGSPTPIHFEGINSVNDYKFNSTVAAGVNIGIMRDAAGYFDYYFVPILADVRVFIPISKIKLFVAADGGYIASLSDAQPGRTTISPSIGITIPVSNKIGIAFTIGYEMQHYSTPYTLNFLTFDNSNSTTSGTISETFNLFKFGVGITF